MSFRSVSSEVFRFLQFRGDTPRPMTEAILFNQGNIQLNGENKKKIERLIFIYATIFKVSENVQSEYVQKT